jgi:hypothetical protein
MSGVPTCNLRFFTTLICNVDIMHINAYNAIMPTVIRINNVKFCVYFDDHGLPHCHVIKGNAEAKIEIDSGKCVAVSGFSEKDVRGLRKFVLANQEILSDAWREYNE